MPQDVPGDRVHGEISVADATAAQPIVFYNTAKAARPIAANEILIVTDVHVSVGAAMSVDVFSDGSGNGNVDAGDRIVGGFLAANGYIRHPFRTELYCHKGVTPKVKSSIIGSVSVIITGIVAQG
jgi:hypothetical protein